MESNEQKLTSALRGELEAAVAHRALKLRVQYEEELDLQYRNYVALRILRRAERARKEALQANANASYSNSLDQDVRAASEAVNALSPLFADLESRRTRTLRAASSEVKTARASFKGRLPQAIIDAVTVEILKEFGGQSFFAQNPQRDSEKLAELDGEPIYQAPKKEELFGIENALDRNNAGWYDGLLEELGLPTTLPDTLPWAPDYPRPERNLQYASLAVSGSTATDVSIGGGGNTPANVLSGATALPTPEAAVSRGEAVAVLGAHLEGFTSSVGMLNAALSGAASSAFDAYADSMEQASATGRFSAAGIGKSARESAKQSLATIGKESAVRGLFEIGYGIKAFATGDADGGKTHMASGAQYMAVAALTTGAGGALGGDKGSGGAKKKRDEVEPAGTSSSSTSKGRVIQHITVIGNPTGSSSVVH